MNALQPYYRNDACQRMAEKAANSDARTTLDVNIQIDRVLSNRNPVIVAQINQCIASDIPFMLYADSEHYAIIVPQNKAIRGYKEGKEYYNSLSATDKEFANAVKMLYVGFDKIYIPELLIEEDSKTLILE